MARKSWIQREKKRQKLEQKYHLIRRSSTNEITKVAEMSEKWEIHGKFMENYNPHRVIVHRQGFIAVVWRPKARERTIDTLGYLGTYFVKWFILVCCQGQHDQVGKDPNILSRFY